MLSEEPCKIEKGLRRGGTLQSPSAGATAKSSCNVPIYITYRNTNLAQLQDLPPKKTMGGEFTMQLGFCFSVLI